MTTFRPLLAQAVETDAEAAALCYPLLASPKIDGIRVLIKDNVAITRSLKPVRNRHVQKLLGDAAFEGLDGEVVAGNVLDPMAFRNTTTAVMAEHGEMDFTYWVFDNHKLLGLPFNTRFADLVERVDPGHKFVKVLPHIMINDLLELQAYEEECLTKGFEGVMLRSPAGKYKHGRSTLKEGILLKLKRGQLRTGDAVVVGFKERMQNLNEATINELGLTERSVHKENLVGRGDLGSFLVKDTDTGYEFAIGTGNGLDDSLRKEVWDNQARYLGKVIRYQWFAYGAYDLPRFPQFVAFRDAEDMS